MNIDKKKLIEMMDSGLSIAKMAEELGIPTSTLYCAMKRAGLQSKAKAGRKPLIIIDGGDD